MRQVPSACNFLDYEALLCEKAVFINEFDTDCMTHNQTLAAILSLRNRKRHFHRERVMVNGTSSEKTNTDREFVLQQLAAFASHATPHEIRHAAHYIVLARAR